MKKMILIALCLGLMALGPAGSAGAYTQAGLTHWNAGDTISMNFNIPNSLGEVVSAWLSISAVNAVGDHNQVRVNGRDVGFIDADSSGSIKNTKFNLYNFFEHYVPIGLPLNVTIYAEGPLSLGSSMLALEYAYLADPPTGTSAPVPEPATLLLLGSGLSGLALWGKRRKMTS